MHVRSHSTHRVDPDASRRQAEQTLQRAFDARHERDAPIVNQSVARDAGLTADTAVRNSHKRCTRMQSVDGFYRLHVVTRKRLGLPVQTRICFRRWHSMIIESSPEFVGIVRAGRLPVAAAIFITDDRTMMYKYGASDPSALGLRPNDFLFFNAM